MQNNPPDNTETIQAHLVSRIQDELAIFQHKISKAIRNYQFRKESKILKKNNEFVADLHLDYEWSELS